MRVPPPEDSVFDRSLALGGEAGALIGAHDWSSTPLGPIGSWPASRKAVIGLILASSVPILTLWGERGVMIHNDAFAALAGMRHPPMLGSAVREGWPEAGALGDEILRAVLAGGTFACRDIELPLARDGTSQRAWLDLDCSPILDEAGRPAGVMAVAALTTGRVLAAREQERVEAALRASETEFRLMADALPVLVSYLEAEPELRYRFVNKVYESWFPRRREDIEGRLVREVVGAEAFANVTPWIERALAGERVSFEQFMPYTEGRPRHIQVEYVPRMGGDGRVEGIYALVQDITDARQATEGLRESEARFREVADAAPVLIWLADATKGCTWFNKPWLDFTGRSMAEEAGYGWADGVHPDDVARCIRTYDEAFDRREPFRMDYRLRRHDGTWRVVDDNGAPRFAPDGTFLGYIGSCVDVTQQRAGEARFRGVFDSDLMGFTIFDTGSGETLLANDRFLAMTGHTRADVDEGRWDWREFTLPEFLPLDEDAIRQARERGWWEPYEKEYRRRDGTRFPIRISSAPLPGEPGRVVVSIQDITGERAAMAALAASEAQLRLGLQAGRMVAWETDLTTGTIARSQNADEIFGPGSLAEDFDTRMPEEDARENKARFVAALKGETDLYECEFRYRHPDGRLLWLHNRGLMIHDAAGRAVRAHGICIDVTARKTVEETLKRLNESLEGEVAERRAERDRIYELSNDLFAVAGFDGYLRTINPAWTRLLGHPEEVLLARPFAAFIHPEDLASAGSTVAALRAGEVVRHFEDRLVRADGSAVWISWAAVPQGDLFYAVGRDVTRDREREEALRQAQKMEAVGQLTGGIAHDFNNLLGAVVGSLDLIRRKPDEPERVRRWAENGLSAAERGAKLTGQLLAFSRAQRIELKPLVLADLIAGLHDLLARALGPGVRLALDLDPARVPVLSDPTQLEMAVLNLAINARDAMPDGGALAIATRPVRLRQDPELEPGDYIELVVSDTGSGMPPEVLARAFDPFFTTKGIGKGTGLGLSQVYGIARQAGGTVRIESEPGRGTSVRLYLRCTEGEAPPEEAARPGSGAKPGPAATVLVVDDDPEMRRMLADALDALGYRVVTAQDGPSGLAALDEAAPDLMILDFAMPGPNGAEVAREVAARRPDLPIVFASGYADTAAIESVAGAHALVLRKPFRVDELQDAVAAALKRKA